VDKVRFFQGDIHEKAVDAAQIAAFCESAFDPTADAIVFPDRFEVFHRFQSVERSGAVFGGCGFQSSDLGKVRDQRRGAVGYAVLGQQNLGAETFRFAHRVGNGGKDIQPKIFRAAQVAFAEYAVIGNVLTVRFAAIGCGKAHDNVEIRQSVDCFAFKNL